MDKKILISIPCLLLGGTEHQTLYLVKTLKSSGYDVTVFCYFEYNQRMVAYMRDAGACVELMTKSGTRPKIFWMIVVELFIGIHKVQKAYNPNVVHVQYMAPGSLAILLFKLLGAKKVIATAHVPGHIYKRKWLPRLISKYFTDCFLCVSMSSEASFFNEEAQLFSQKLFATGRKHFTIYNCVKSAASYVQATQQKHKQFTLGIVSRLSYEKGIDIMLAAMPEVLKICPYARVLIVGGGEEKERLTTQAKQLEIVDSIAWVGLQAKEQLATYYAQMDLVAVPSRFEGFGLTAIEAMSYGIPVVASAVDGLEEVIENGKSGVLVQKESPELLAKAILNLIEDETIRNTIAKAGKQRVEDFFSFDDYKHQISDLYEAVLNG